ncbi:MAG: hypothetical protein ACLQIB_06510 [Isosphaeraceae bacterium]
MLLIGWFLNLVWISLLLFAPFVGFLIVPKWEASWKARGMPIPVWALVLIEITHFIIKYWYALLIGSAVWIWLARPPSAKPTE